MAHPTMSPTLTDLRPHRQLSRPRLTCNVASCRLILLRRTELVKRIRKIAKAKNATATFDEGSSHTIVRFNGRKVTLVGRHNEIPEWTARGALRDVERWEP